jgi:hypothetical protein
LEKGEDLLRKTSLNKGMHWKKGQAINKIKGKGKDQIKLVCKWRLR